MISIVKTTDIRVTIGSIHCCQCSNHVTITQKSTFKIFSMQHMLSGKYEILPTGVKF